MNEQVRTQEQIQFENTFFSLIEQHNKALDKISAELEKYAGGRSELNIFLTQIESKRFSINAAKIHLESRNSVFGSYYRVLYQVLKFVAINCPGSKISPSFYEHEIKNAPLAPNEKMYVNMVRAFLGHYATQVLSINCYCSSIDDIYYKYKLLVERYSMLEHMPFRVVRERYSNALLGSIKFYDKSAFGNSDYLKSYKKCMETESGRTTTD